MSRLLSKHHRSIDVMVNGRYYSSVKIRQMNKSLLDFDVLIDDSQVGSITLTETMVLGLRSDSGWQSTSLASLKKGLAEHTHYSSPFYSPSSSDIGELKLSKGSRHDLRDSTARSERMSWLHAYDRCVRRVRAVLGESDIASLPCGGVFVVANRTRARAILLRAGFLPSTISNGALTETFSGCSVYLVECPPVSTRSQRSNA